MKKGKVISGKKIFAAIALAAAVIIIMIIIFSSISLSDSGDNASANVETAADVSGSSVYDSTEEYEAPSVTTESAVPESETVTETAPAHAETTVPESTAVTDSEAVSEENSRQTTESASDESEIAQYSDTSPENALSESDDVIRLVIDLTADTEKMNKIFASVIEQNAEKLENIVEYGDKFCTHYISVKNDLKVHEAVLEELRILSNAICDGETDDYEKVRKIAYWVAENVYYNEVAASTSVNEETISLETVLETKTATCAGYSNLFSALCNMQDIYCINMRGGTCAAVTSDEFLLYAPVNHEWNAVKLAGKWIFVDTAWLSNNKYTDNGYQKSNSFDDIYFGMSLELMSYEHRIDLVDYRNFRSSVNAFDENGRWAE